MTPPPRAEAGALALHAPSPLELIRARGRFRGTLPLLGAAFVASIAYVDPGNFATNIMAMATDLAEVVGAALALNILFGVALLPAGVMVGLAAFAILALRDRGYRRFEVTIVSMLAVILVAFLYDTLRIGGNAPDIARGFVPSFGGSGSILLAAGILGATIMPHVIYLHSSLTKNRIPARDDGERRQLLRFQRLDVGVAMGLAGVVNIAMLIAIAAVFHHPGRHITTIQGAHAGLSQHVGQGAALAFALALLASGLAASSVGTQAGQVVMQGFIRRRIPIVLRRLITLAPALVILAIGLDPTRSLVISQVILSFGIPFALVPLVILTSRSQVMGKFVNRRATSGFAYLIAALLIVLNVFLIAQTLLG